MKEVQQGRIVYGRMQVDGEVLHIAATANGLCYVGGVEEDFESFIEWCQKNRPNDYLEEAEKEIGIYKDQIEAFFNKEIRTFTLQLDIIGTAFQRDVWQALRNIPYGEVRTYSDIAKEVDRPNAVRAVGSAIGANPILIINPCHRVINKSGKLGGFRGGIQMKRMLLDLEKASS